MDQTTAQRYEEACNIADMVTQRWGEAAEKTFCGRSAQLDPSSYMTLVIGIVTETSTHGLREQQMQLVQRLTGKAFDEIEIDFDNIGDLFND